MILRVVAWCNVWNRAAALHSDVGTLLHVTDAAGLAGTTLCGRAYPADKGYPAAVRYCKHCLKKADQPIAAVRALAYVPSREE